MEFSLITNGCPKQVINYIFIQKVKQLNVKPVYKAEKCLVYFNAPYIGIVSTRFKKQINHGSQTRRSNYVFYFYYLTTLANSKKDMLRSHNCNNVIYQFECHCNNRYINCTSQQLLEGIKQHIPKKCVINSRLLKPRQSFSPLQSYP